MKPSHHGNFFNPKRPNYQSLAQYELLEEGVGDKLYGIKYFESGSGVKCLLSALGMNKLVKREILINILCFKNPLQ